MYESINYSYMVGLSIRMSDTFEANYQLAICELDSIISIAQCVSNMIAIFGGPFKSIAHSN